MSLIVKMIVSSVVSKTYGCIFAPENNVYEYNPMDSIHWFTVCTTNDGKTLNNVSGLSYSSPPWSRNPQPVESCRCNLARNNTSG